MAIAKEIILVGGSAGSYPLITTFLGQLPSYFEQAICIVLHRNKKFETQIESSLAKKLQRNITSVYNNMKIQKNYVYFAPAGYHLLVEPDYRFSLDCSEYINYSRPSIDVLFETAAQIYKKSCTAFLLSGANADGAQGLALVEAFGGRAIVQNPECAIIDTMPRAGIKATTGALVWNDEQIISFFKDLK